MGAEPTLALSFLAGLLSFLSPCVVPLVPSYISFVGGSSAISGDTDAPSRGLVLLRTALFVSGFTIVFVLLGIIFSGSGMLFSNTGRVINIVAGSIVVILGLNIIFDFWNLLNMEARFHFQKRPSGALGSVLIGMAFGAGWTPCIGPILASILFLAGTSGNIGTGALYLVAFSLGLGLPFLLAGAFMDRAHDALRRLRPYLPAIKVGSGVLLVGVGLLIALGRLQQLSARLLGWGARLAAWDATHPVLSDVVFSAAVVSLFAAPLAIRVLRGASRRRNELRVAGEGDANATAAENDAVVGAAGGSTGIVRVAVATMAAAGLGLAVLNLTGTISIAQWVAGWFRFTGL